MFGFRWLRTRSCHRVTRWHSSLHTSGSRRARPCATACHSCSRTGLASTGRSRASRCRTGSRTRSRWVRSSSSKPRMCRPTVHCPCTAHGCRSRPDASRSGPQTGSSSVVTPCAPRFCRTVNPATPVETGAGRLHPNWMGRRGGLAYGNNGRFRIQPAESPHRQPDAFVPGRDAGYPGDPRGDRTQLHHLTDILALSMPAVIGDADSFVTIALFGQFNEAWLHTFAAVGGIHTPARSL